MKRKIILVTFGVILVAGVLIFSLSKKGRKTETIPPVISQIEGSEVIEDRLFSTVFLTEFFDFESSANLENTVTILKGTAFSGTQSSHQTAQSEYGVTYSRKFSEIENHSGLKEIIFSTKFFSKSQVGEVLAVLSVDGPDGKNIEWYGEPLNVEPGSWKDFTVKFPIKSTSLKGDNILKLYIWNKSKSDFFTDNMKIEFFGLVKNVLTPSVSIPERNIINDFEILSEGENPESYVSDIFKSGTKSFLLDSKTAYTPSVVKRIHEVIDSEFRLITLSANIFPKSENVDVVLVVSLKDPDGKEYSWHGRSTDKGMFPANEWTKHRAQFKLPFEKIKPDDIVSAYVWNKSGDKVYIDDFEVVFGETNVRGGGKPVLDMTTLDENGYSFPKNVAPFRKAYFSKVEIGNNDSGYLTGSGESIEKYFNSFATVTAGNFIQNTTGLQQLFVIENGKGVLYSFCTEKKRFNIIDESANSSLPSWISGAHISAADFNGDGIDEIFVNGSTSEKLMLVSFADGLSLCESNSGKESKINITAKLPVNGDGLQQYFKSEYVLISGDFGGDKKSEILTFDPQSGAYGIFGIENQQLINLHATTQSEELNIGQKAGAFSVTRFRPPGINKDRILISYRKAGRTFIKLAGLSDNGTKLSIFSDPTIPDKFLSHKTSIFHGQFSASGADEFIIYNSDWRFELKLAKVDNYEMIITNDLDFSGFPPRRNPKFYESRKLVTGKFTQGTVDQILTVVSNCDDSDFDGSRCKSISNSETFPPSIQLYQFAKPANQQ